MSLELESEQHSASSHNKEDHGDVRLGCQIWATDSLYPLLGV